MMDLNVPGGGVSVLEWSGALSVDTIIVDEVSERGSMKRMLNGLFSMLSGWRKGYDGVGARVRGNDGEWKSDVLVVQVVVELEVQALHVLQRRDHL